MKHNKIITALGLWAVSATCAYATTVGFSQVGSESGWPRIQLRSATLANIKQPIPFL